MQFVCSLYAVYMQFICTFKTTYSFDKSVCSFAKSVCSFKNCI